MQKDEFLILEINNGYFRLMALTPMVNNHSEGKGYIE